MEYSYYRDSRHHYLTIPCPEVENYQYRMLAANRMETLIPCSIRNVDGRRYLYYDITARESMTEFFHGHGNAAQEIPRLLYAIADAGTVLERYLLDCSRMLLGPEFVFYDYTRGEFSFLYYPEDPEEPSGPAFYEYLADHADPQDKMLYYTLLRLISISANRTFVLEEGFLERALGRKRPEGDPLAAEQAMHAERMGAHYGNDAWSDASSEYRAAGSRRELSGYAGSDVDKEALRMLEEGDPEDPDDDDLPEAARRHGRHLGLYVAGAVVFLAGAIGLACVRMYIPMNETYSAAARSGMLACLGASILTAVYGTYRGMRSSRLELRSVRDHARLERRNALTPVDDFR